MGRREEGRLRGRGKQGDKEEGERKGGLRHEQPSGSFSMSWRCKAASFPGGCESFMFSRTSYSTF